MTSEVNVKLNDIYKLVDQLVAASQEEDVFPSALNSGTMSPSTTRKDKPVKDMYGRKYSTTSNMTSETVETACESENRDDQQKRIGTSGAGLAANLAVPASPRKNEMHKNEMYVVFDGELIGCTFRSCSHSHRHGG